MLWLIESLENPDDRKFIDDLYGSFKWLMFKTARRYVSTLPDQEDIVHDAIERLIRRADTLRERPRCVLPRYVVYTVRSAAVDLLRRRKRWEARVVPLDEDMSVWTMASGNEPLDAVLIAEELRARLWEIWPRLPEEDQLLLEGKYVWELSDRELAEDVGCKPDSIRMKLTRARRRAYRYITEGEGV